MFLLLLVSYLSLTVYRYCAIYSGVIVTVSVSVTVSVTLTKNLLVSVNGRFLSSLYGYKQQTHKVSSKLAH